MENTCIVRIGQNAPEFKTSGYDARKKTFADYSLADFKGKYTLLFFYPGDFTYVWPTELVALAKLHKEFEEANVQVLVLSTDSKFSHKAWHEDELGEAAGGEYPYPMLSDPAGKIGAAYGVYNGDAAQDIRGTVLIDKQGVVQLLYVNTPPIGRSPEELLRCALALKEHDETGKVIPANWTPGGETITPAIENSGKMWQNYKGIMQDKK